MAPHRSKFVPLGNQWETNPRSGSLQLSYAHATTSLVDGLEAARLVCILMTTDELSELISTAFPIKPVPERFWIDDSRSLVGVIPDELAKRIAHRPWDDVTMLDWTMTGAHASTARGYIDPNAFRYYLPSLLIGGLNDLRYIDWTLECLLPAGRKRRTTGRWLQEF